jgi:hypothetical protein
LRTSPLATSASLCSANTCDAILEHRNVEAMACEPRALLSRLPQRPPSPRPCPPRRDSSHGAPAQQLPASVPYSLPQVPLHQSLLSRSPSPAAPCPLTHLRCARTAGKFFPSALVRMLLASLMFPPCVPAKPPSTSFAHSPTPRIRVLTRSMGPCAKRRCYPTGRCVNQPSVTS